MEGIKRLEKMLEGEDDNALIKVVDFLKTKPNISSKFLNQEKNLSEMRSYIHKKAKENSNKKEWVCIDNEVIYAWAMLYFLMPNKTLGIEKEKKKSTNKKNNVVKMPEKKETKEIKKEEPPKPQNQQITLFQTGG